MNIHRHTHNRDRREANSRQRDRETERQRDRETERASYFCARDVTSVGRFTFLADLSHV
jgi:hypothetical protein